MATMGQNNVCIGQGEYYMRSVPSTLRPHRTLDSP
jgi:hypothetical protein